MGQLSAAANAVTSLLLLPGDLICNAVGVGTANNRDLLRMLVNSFAWAFVGALVVIAVV